MIKRKTNIIVIAILASTLVAGCGEEVKVKHVSSSETIILKSNINTPNQIRIIGNGRIEGIAKISLILEGKVYKSETLNGDVNFEWNTDWYSNKAILEYEAGNTKSGNLVIKYKFM